MGVPLPSTLLLRERFEELLGRSVSLSSGPPVLPTSSTITSAVYVDVRLRTIALVAFDLAAATSLGAVAARRVPVVAEEALAARELPDALEDGLRSVARGLATLFSRPERRVHRMELHAPGVEVFDVRPTLRTVRNRADVRVQPKGYAAGRCSVIVLPEA
jgi:hypothetical protein